VSQSFRPFVDSQITPAKKSRQLYTLDQIPDAIVAPPHTAPVAAIHPSTAPAVPVPWASSTPASTGPIRTARKSRKSTGPFPTRVNKSVPASAAHPTNTTVPQVEASQVQSPNVDVSQVHTPQVDPQATALSSNAPRVDAVPTEPNVVATTPSPDTTSLPAAQVPSDGESDGRSYTSTLPDVYDVGMDDSAPLATGPWMIIDHLTGEIIVDKDQPTAPTPDVSTIPTIPACRSLAGVEVAITPHLGTAYLAETPPALLSEDEDVRPQWLTTAVNSFLRFVPCIGSLGKVIDLYLTQEARLGYPELVRTVVFSSVSSILTVSVHSPSTPILQLSHRDCHIYEMGQEVCSW